MVARFSGSEMRRSSSPVCAVILPILLVMFLVMFVSVPALMLAQNPNGSLRGEVQDASAARVAGARIVVE